MFLKKAVDKKWGKYPIELKAYLDLCKPYHIFVTDLGSGGESVKKLETKIFVGNTATNTAKTELIKVRSAVFFSR